MKTSFEKANKALEIWGNILAILRENCINVDSGDLQVVEDVLWDIYDSLY